MRGHNPADSRSGKRPRYHETDDLPKPTEHMKQRTEDLGIEKNLNKTVLVQATTTGKGPRGAGFYVRKVPLRSLDDS
jgi:U4/U6.U5 tri-snRNP component SNU23